MYVPSKFRQILSSNSPSQPFKDHMIRERVSTDGTCRPLEPPQELDAMTMPRDEIGFIKEGPAKRYLNGQALWDKKYAHTRKQVAKRRQKNLKDAKQKDAKKIVRLWQDKVRVFKADNEKTREERRRKRREEKRKTKALAVDGQDRGDVRDGSESEGSEDERDGEETETGTETEGLETEEDGRIMDQSWSWNWALEGEEPPPSAIVSRRDFVSARTCQASVISVSSSRKPADLRQSEARHLALMADRMDDRTSTPIHGLSIWVGLAACFSNSSERSKAHDALKQAHDAQKAQKANKGSVSSSESGSGSNPFRKMSRALGLGKKMSADRAPTMKGIE